MNLGARFRFRLSDRNATLRLQMTNVGSESGFDVEAAGAYRIIPGRVISTYPTIDL